MRRWNNLLLVRAADRRDHGPEAPPPRIPGPRPARKSWRGRKRTVEDLAAEFDCDPDDRRTWPRCAECRVTLSLAHARKADRCVSGINRAGDHNEFLRAAHHDPRMRG